MREDVRIWLDCGSPSLYNQLVRQDTNAGHMGSFLKDRKHDDHSYVDTQEYKKYFENYISFILEHEEHLEVYSNLDVINNAEGTWKNQQIMEDAGLNPIPVYHFGSDLKWLKMYLDKGYDYIAIGGMVPNPPNILIPALDKIWSNYLTDDDGMPLVKVHGFAVTSVQLVNRYPWYSVDSTSWVKFGRYGVVCIPRLINGRYDYTVNAWNVAVSPRSPSQKERGKHFTTYAPAEQKVIMDYVSSKGLIYGSSKIFTIKEGYELKEGERKFAKELGGDKNTVERIVEHGICNDYKLRDELNILYYLDLEKSIQPWPWAFKQKIKIKKFKVKK